jgi:hypothetical protein
MASILECLGENREIYDEESGGGGHDNKENEVLITP